MPLPPIMPRLRRASFNVENLLARYRLRQGFAPTAGDGPTPFARKAR